ncbi:MAG: 4Fe-4S ferredoxin, partial [Paramuribaculum sp.]|nr:4Fe-4S ferredoxin [Paramuribaculum sp.]
MIHSFVFSPSGTSRKVADIFTKAIGVESKIYDLTVHGIGRIDIKDADDIVVFVAPVYAGRVPALASERFMAVNGHRQKAVAIAVYGNRDYDDALVEMCDIISARGF